MGTLHAQRKGTDTMHHAAGSFEAKLVPADTPEIPKAAGIGAMTIDKTWHGDLEGTSQGEMLHAAEATTGAMAYVALERVTGKLGGKSGSFLFSHTASMLKSNPAAAELSVTVVPHSGTGELANLSGSLKIIIDAKGAHTYEFDYRFDN
ncbi:MAG: DUF3224 domain-containing protein [Acidobacteriaceae bacterium]|nr:DUF3224 domain-containing protein [Acidobacteriaceae bacterium]